MIGAEADVITLNDAGNGWIIASGVGNGADVGNKTSLVMLAVHAVLEHYVHSRDYSGVLALCGTGGVAEGYDPKAASRQ